MKKLFLLFFVLFATACDTQTHENGAQVSGPETEKTYIFTEEEVKTLYNSIQELEHSDSLNIEIINGLEEQIKLYEKHIYSDSLLSVKYEEKIALLEKQVELHKQLQPKWWEKPLWFSSGVAVILVPTWILGQFK